LRNDSLKVLEKKLAREKNPKSGFFIAKDILKLIEKLKIEERGEPPNPLRHVGKGTKGELWYRNRLLWLRTIPLEKDISFMITHSEPSVYYKGENGCNSADLLGIWHSKASTKLGVAELKAGEKGDHMLYAILEGARNAYLHRLAIKRLYSGWSKALNQSPQRGEGLFWASVWNEGNPFNNKLTKTHLIIIGDNKWIQAQEKWNNEAKKITNAIKKIFGFETSIYSLDKKAQPGSKPYVLLPLEKWKY